MVVPGEVISTSAEAEGAVGRLGADISEVNVGGKYSPFGEGSSGDTSRWGG